MGESIFATSPLPIARRGKGGVVDGTRAVELGVAALQRSLCTSKHMKMAPLQTHPEALRTHRWAQHSTPKGQLSLLSGAREQPIEQQPSGRCVGVEGDRRRQSCMFKDLVHEAVQHLKCACMCTYDPPFICRASLPSCLPGERQPKFSYVLLLSPCFFDSFLEVTEVGAASFHLPQT